MLLVHHDAADTAARKARAAAFWSARCSERALDALTAEARRVTLAESIAIVPCVDRFIAAYDATTAGDVPQHAAHDRRQRLARGAR